MHNISLFVLVRETSLNKLDIKQFIFPDSRQMGCNACLHFMEDLQPQRIQGIKRCIKVLIPSPGISRLPGKLPYWLLQLQFNKTISTKKRQFAVKG